MSSKGVAPQFFDIGDPTPNGPTATLRLGCFLRDRDGHEHAYGVDSPLLGYSYYGEVLQSTKDLKTSACCDPSAVPAWLKPLLSRIHPEVLSRYYGCGLVAPTQLDGLRVLDLGSGSGAARFTGPDKSLSISPSRK